MAERETRRLWRANGRRSKKLIVKSFKTLMIWFGVLGAVVLGSPVVMAAEGTSDIVSKVLDGNPENFGISIKLLLITTVVAVAPALLLLTTSFTRIIIVLGFVRRAIGAQDAPPNQVIFGLSLLLTLVVMGPTWSDIYENSIQPYSNQEVSPVTGDVVTADEAFSYADTRVREFMYPFISPEDLILMAKAGAPETYRDLYDEEAAVVTREFADSLPLTVVVPAFVLAELKLAFQMGVMIFIPFLVIDLVVSAILVAMGMFMLPPILVSLPFKILVFVLADGWSLVVEQLLFTGSRVVA